MPRIDDNHAPRHEFGKLWATNFLTQTEYFLHSFCILGRKSLIESVAKKNTRKKMQFCRDRIFYTHKRLPQNKTKKVREQNSHAL